MTAADRPANIDDLKCETVSCGQNVSDRARSKVDVVQIHPTASEE